MATEPDKQPVADPRRTASVAPEVTGGSPGPSTDPFLVALAARHADPERHAVDAERRQRIAALRHRLWWHCRYRRLLVHTLLGGAGIAWHIALFRGDGRAILLGFIAGLVAALPIGIIGLPPLAALPLYSLIATYGLTYGLDVLLWLWPIQIPCIVATGAFLGYLSSWVQADDFWHRSLGIASRRVAERETEDTAEPR